MMATTMMMTTALLMMSSLGRPAACRPAEQKPELELTNVIDLFDGNISLPKVSQSHFQQNIILQKHDIDGDLKKNIFSSPQGDFDNLKHLAEGDGRCGAKFFCKAHQLLDQHNTTKEIATYINIYNQLKEFKCKDVLKDVHPTGYQYKMEALKKHVIECIQYKIIRIRVSSSSSSSGGTPSANATQPSV
ncbi:uncharacterized protein LOC144006683 isoform X1 [Festucalex cinctus]